MIIYLLLILKQKRDIGRILAKNYLKNRWVKLIYKFSKSVLKLVIKYRSPKSTMRHLMIIYMIISDEKL